MLFWRRRTFAGSPRGNDVVGRSHAAPARSCQPLIGAVAALRRTRPVESARPPYELREIVRHVYQFGYRSAPLILAAGFAIGVVLSMHTRASLERFGAEAMIPAGSRSRSFAKPARSSPRCWCRDASGAGIGAEIGAMKVTEQIDALEASAVDAFKYLAVDPHHRADDRDAAAHDHDGLRRHRRRLRRRGGGVRHVVAAVLRAFLQPTSTTRTSSPPR
jgi:hypothetical protein